MAQAPRTMAVHGLAIIVVAICCFNHIESFGFDSSDASRTENGIYGPIYDALLFNDIADILNELDSNGHSPLEALINSESESDENEDDLLSEYQHFLEKAHEQRKNYLEKNKTKNKVPLYRHETYVKNKPDTSKYDDHYPSNMHKSSIIKFPRSYYKSPLEFLIPMNPKNQQPPEISSDPEYRNPKNYLNYGPIQVDSHQVRGDLAPLFPLEFMSGNQNENKNYFTPEQKPVQQTVPLFDRSSPDSENALNIRIKVEIQAPKFLGAPGSHHCRNHTHRAWENTEVESAPSTLSVPFPYYNFPMPMEMLSFKAPKSNKPDGAQYHKIVIHKKKKTRPSSASKRHRKKLISFHDVKFDPRPRASTIFVQTFMGSNINNSNITNTTEDSTFNVTSKTDKPKPIDIGIKNITSTTMEPIQTTEIQEDEVIHLTKDQQSSITVTEENVKNENSIEVDDLKSNSSGVMEKTKNSRKRRETLVNGTSSTSTSTEKSKPKVEELKKVDIFSFTDPELLNWPNANASNHKTAGEKNITVLILERENKKAKLNISQETIRFNHKTALEKAIFGEVNWDDVDTVAPVFISFVGKYLTGVLTFCSPTICHSMKCAQKECIHRVCAPSERPNNKGHCEGSNSTDSVASMESLMDLPSNVAFEIVDILQDNMQGKMFGKVTLCISPKCITFASAKKSFLKHKCTIKELSSSGHCQNLKNIKNR